MWYVIEDNCQHQVYFIRSSYTILFLTVIIKEFNQQNTIRFEIIPISVGVYYSSALTVTFMIKYKVHLV